VPEPAGVLARARHAVEYAGVRLLLAAVRVLPMAVLRPLTGLVARAAFLLLRKRRAIAIENVRQALGPDLPPGKARALALGSVRSFLLTAMPEIAKLAGPLTSPDAREWLNTQAPELRELFARARELHDETRGCIFVTPHLGNWELLPFVSAAVGIPLAVVVRPLDNPRLERLLYRSRTSTGQVFVARRNSLSRLQMLLAQGMSVGLLPDQATIKGLAVDFLGRPALTTPVPALLALYHHRPIVVVACFRTGDGRFGGHVGEPIWPLEGRSEKAEVLRLTEAMTKDMEVVIRAHPEQYFWMHNRWKTYS
jgi:KDO2-lipid IV(A) lauroyltransferase